MSDNELNVMTARTERLVDSISSAILDTVAVAAERISISAEVARVAQRLGAFSAILEGIAAQKESLATKLAGTRNAAMRTLLKLQIDMLTGQETAVLERAGVGPEVARIALDQADDVERATYVRDGKRFTKAVGKNADDNGCNGASVTK